LILAEYLENYADQIAKKSVILARHAGRKTIQKEDIEICVRILGE
jgi:histone H3/H4